MFNRKIYLSVGIFLLAAIFATLVLAFRISGLTQWGASKGYTISADFDNVGGLKPRASVRIGGVTIGRVDAIQLNPKSYQAHVVMRIEQRYRIIPDDSTASIYTQGLLGANYVNLVPGYSEKNLVNGGEIETTHSAMILENLIGQLLFSMKGNSNKDQSSEISSTQPVNPVAPTAAPSTQGASS